MKKHAYPFITIFLSLLVLGGCGHPGYTAYTAHAGAATAPDTSDSAASPNSGITPCLRQALSIPDGACNQDIAEILAQAEHLELPGSGLDDIGFLRSMPNLKTVNLDNNDIRDLSPLEKCTQLEQLSASHNQIKDITPLKNLTRMTALSLEDNEITDISAISGLTRLVRLDISGNRIQDISCLKNLDRLFLCSFGRNPAEDISPLIQIPYATFYAERTAPPDTAVNAAGKAQKWLEENCDELDYYALEDIAAGDIDRDGTEDIAVVLSCIHEAGGNLPQARDVSFIDSARRPVALTQKQIWDSGSRYGSRRLFLLLGRKDGGFRRAGSEPYISSYGEGGMRGDPYRGLLMGNGYLMIQESSGSRSGRTETSCYRYNDSALELVRSNIIEDDNYADGYDVSVVTYPQERTTSFIYALKDGYDYVRIPRENLGTPEGAPRIGLDSDYGSGYRYFGEMLQTGRSASEALDLAAHESERFFKALNGNTDDGFSIKREPINYTGSSRGYYEKLKGIILPDFYYKGHVTLKKDAGEEQIEIIIKYNRCIMPDGQARHCCLLQYRKPGQSYVDWREIYVNDEDGAVILN